jgi:hypothetical protein
MLVLITPQGTFNVEAKNAMVKRPIYRKQPKGSCLEFHDGGVDDCDDDDDGDDNANRNILPGLLRTRVKPECSCCNVTGADSKSLTYIDHVN